ncbi:GGDEF domain-containing protein [Myxococcota bacterium]|nr:GGDEF domain-containing protein [Myxococcota bacterium]
MSFELSPLVRSVVDASVDACAVVDGELGLVYHNSQYLRLAGLRPRALSGRRATAMCHEHFGLESCQDGCISARVFRTARAIRVDEVRSTRLPLRVIVTAIPLLRDDGTVYAVLETYRDVTAESRVQENYRRLLERERAQRELLAAEVARQTVELERANTSLRAALTEVSRLAVTDGLTGLSNRRSFDEQLAERLAEARRVSAPLSLVLFDLDFFKRVNDEHGHPAGDRLLREFATVLCRASRVEDVAARIGGEEFALVLSGATLVEAAGVASRVQQCAREARLMTTASGGVANYPGDGATPTELLKAADRALYAAKRGGRNRIVTAASLPPRTATADLVA